MDIEPNQLQEPGAEQDLDAWNPWNLPSSAPVPTPAPDEWPEREARFEEAFAHLEGKRA